jgi:autotransporter-associated beta strand protein
LQSALTISSLIQDGGISKQGNGILLLSNAGNNYTGTTAISAGPVVVSGAISGTSSVSVSGTIYAGLAVTGSVTTPGALTLGNNSTLSGNGIITAGTLTASSTNAADPAIVEPSSGNAAGLTIDHAAVTLSTNSTLQLSIANSNAGSHGVPALADYSKLTLGTGVSANISGSDIAVTITGSVNAGDLFTIILNNGGSPVIGTFANTTLVSGSTYAFTSNGQQYEINYAFNGPTTGSGLEAAFQADSGGANVAILVVPEPNSWSMLLGSLGVVLGLQRFRRRRS